VISASLMQNRDLKMKIVLNGNPIGQLGSKALMMVPTIAGSRIKLECKMCNVDITEKSDKFSFMRLIKDYHLNMSSPFDRAAVIILTHLIAGHASFVFKSISHEYRIGDGKLIKSKITLSDDILGEDELDLDHESRKVLKGWRRIKAAAENIDLAVRLFNEVDMDKSGKSLATLVILHFIV
jgi:hypothetical protein